MNEAQAIDLYEVCTNTELYPEIEPLCDMFWEDVYYDDDDDFSLDDIETVEDLPEFVVSYICNETPEVCEDGWISESLVCEKAHAEFNTDICTDDYFNGDLLCELVSEDHVYYGICNEDLSMYETGDEDYEWSDEFMQAMADLCNAMPDLCDEGGISDSAVCTSYPDLCYDGIVDPMLMCDTLSFDEMDALCEQLEAEVYG